VTKQEELEAEIERLQDEVGVLEQERDEARDQLVEAADERELARHRASPAYEAELRGKLLEMDHYGLFKGIASRVGMHAQAIRRGWDMLKQDLGYQVNGNATEPELVQAVGKLRDHASYMFTDAPASASPTPQRWLPSGPPPTNGTARLN
jgi:hypothetical protein